jgi:ribokinase
MIGAVGDDDFGRPLLANLRAHGVDVDHVAVHPGGTSGMSVAITEAAGDYAAVIVSGVNLGLGPAAVAAARDRIAGARWLLLQNEVPDAANLAAATLARRAGCQVILNAAPARAAPPGLLEAVDILVVNALEAEALCGVAVPDAAAAGAAAAALCARVPCAIVTAGGDGLAVATAAGWRARLAAHDVTLVSTHGAGDCFVGALAARLAAGGSLDAALRYANAAAALLVATPPEARGDLGPAAVERLLARAGPAIVSDPGASAS